MASSIQEEGGGKRRFKYAASPRPLGGLRATRGRMTGGVAVYSSITSDSAAWDNLMKPERLPKQKKTDGS
jgi:hypothetical protein